MKQCSLCNIGINIRTKSNLCRSCCQIGKKQSASTRKLRSGKLIGITRSPQTRFKMSVSKLGEKNHNWKGNAVQYAALHDWVKRHKPKVLLCENCNIQKPRDAANISGKYKRDLTDWKWLCRKCHMHEDGRMLNLKQFKLL